MVLAVNHFAWSVVVINSSGSLLVGWALPSLTARSRRRRVAFLSVGLAGAYTTFGTVMIEALTSVREGDPGPGVLFLAGSVLAGLAGARLGRRRGRLT